MTMPNFLIIGAAKSGTTALHEYLQQHPQVYMTPNKETNFFAFEGEVIDFNGPGDNGVKNFSITDLETYQAEFEQVTNELALGEACPSYLYLPKAAPKIKKYVPNTRLIVILRNPVERAYANFLHLVRDNREPHSDFISALKDETTRIENNWEWFWHYIQVGYYGSQLQRYYEMFSPSQIKVYLYEDFKTKPVALIQDICRFLEIDNTFVPDMSYRPNRSGVPRNRTIHSFVMKPNLLKDLFKPLLPNIFRQNIKNQVKYNNLEKPPISQSARQYLIKLYREDIIQCQNLINRDLSPWLAEEVSYLSD
ncbi:MAG: sulfotransferase [Xenococcaceae cyanobacterium MO_188.B29]|nr:sulfotransferase [Xenococcaceae cyanobacterium MO_188.B29]